jgi:hypothetical protein
MVERAYFLPVTKPDEVCLNYLLKQKIVPFPEGGRYINEQICDNYQPKDKTMQELWTEESLVMQEIRDAEKLSYIFENYTLPFLDKMNLPLEIKNLTDTMFNVIERYATSLYRGLHFIQDDHHSKKKLTEKKSCKRKRQKKNRKHRKFLETQLLNTGE